MTDANPDGKFGIPGGAEIWANTTDGYWYVAYRIPGTGTPMVWRIESDADVAAIFGPEADWHVDRTMTWSPDNNPEGILTFGPSRQLANLSEHPFDAFTTNFETEARVRPWLRDPEVLAITTRALLEGRTATEAELSGTGWWRTHNQAQRQWAQLNANDPAQADVVIRDMRDAVRQQLKAVGVADAPESLVQWLGDQTVSGNWSQQYLGSQLSKLGDPYAPGELDATLQQQLNGAGLNTLADNTAKVDQLLRQWVGPAVAAGFTDDQKRSWAGRLRNDPQAEEEIVAQLGQYRVALMPEYADPTMSYDSIAAPWRSVVRQTWGQDMSETDPLFQQVLRTGGGQGTSKDPGGLAGVQQLLLKEGLSRNVGTVVNGALSSLGQAFGGSQRGVA